MTATENLVFLKLGGSLITDKTRPYTHLPKRIRAIAEEISEALSENESLRLVLGHGSGSFGHTAGKEYRTREGLSASKNEARYWRGFAETHYQAAKLNALVMDSLRDAGLAAVSLAPSAMMTAEAGRPLSCEIRPLRAALDAGLLPVVYGDAVFDGVRGGTILSTEEIFSFLATQLPVERILLAGLEEGVYADFPARTRIFREITPASLEEKADSFGASHGTDVTGGMSSKVREMLTLIASHEGLEIRIFSGVQRGNILRALRGESLGTLLRGA